ncbi:hypothetical protein PROH_04355 [Prochlorothrix hollandica PCC 9006 = CALU 1027]|uniref:Uncharacterized protein n=1 Tax=Prochlorothrix hollandica PCC 9006 = CALU 1027 TaxID=317619 RepID=A0A0M2PYM7_PROHO|nr:hypothetical protein PROH_04355 [Prochlorothrix hollandica PCC 9006 = CALU 1027]
MTQTQWAGVTSKAKQEAKQEAKKRRPGFHAYFKHPVLLLPSGPDKIWASKLHGPESAFTIP